MDKTVYLAMTGAKNTQLAQAMNSHNLANINTPGFKSDQLDFRSVFVKSNTLGSRVYSVVEGSSSNFEEGAINNTGNPLDIAINGPGWIAVQSPQGDEAYTRAGNLRISQGGILTNGAGHPVLGDGGPIAVPPATNVSIGDDGTVSIVAVGESIENVVTLERIKLVNPEDAQLKKGEDGLFRLPNGEIAEADAAVQLSPGSLESSNVSAIGALVQMIDLARTYELQVKTMQNAQENDRADAQLLSLS